MPRWSALFPLLVLLTGCWGGADDPVGGDPLGPGAIPPQLTGGGTIVDPGGNLEEAFAGNAGVVLDEEDIVFTDPDAEDIDGAIPELRELLSSKPQQGPWRDSYTVAFREARKQEKPVLMWFTDSKNSPSCKALSQDLFNREEFEDWASHELVRLRIDQRISGSTLTDDVSRKLDWVKELKKRYRILGQPYLLVLTPSGEVIGRYKGYRRGQAEFKWGQIRQGTRLANKRHEEWRASMEKRGYRTWRDPRGRKIFAKLKRYHKGELLLVEPDGNRVRTKVRHLSPADQDWIEEQKRARGIE